MLTKVLGAFLGGKAAERTRGIGGPTGAALGVLVPVIIRRMSWPAMVALGIGGYVAKKVIDREATTPEAQPAE
jgi:hypothetical protein